MSERVFGSSVRVGWESRREPCRRRVNKGRGVGHAECHYFKFVGEERVQRGKAGLTWEDADKSREKAVCDPSENSISENPHLAEHGGVGHQKVGTIC